MKMIISKKKYKINCDKSIKDTDEEKDKEYLNELDKDIKNFYIEKCGEIFNFLKQIHLCRYIDEFLKRGFDLYEEFIEIKEDFFKKMKTPFLNEEQQEKFYNKLNEIKKSNNNIINGMESNKNNIIKNINNKFNLINGQTNIINNNNLRHSSLINTDINNILEKAQKISEINIQT